MKEDKSMNHVMLDLETLGTKPGCAILSIGAVKFNPRSGELDTLHTFYQAISFEGNSQDGFTIDTDTIKWWLKQSPEAQRVFFDPSSVSVLTALSEFSEWFPEGASVWAHGLSFDIPVLERAYVITGQKCPWGYKQGRDTRTLYDISGKIEGLTQHGTHHNALDDAVFQAESVCAAYRRLIEAGLM